MVKLKIPTNYGQLDDAGVQKPLTYRQIGSLPLQFGTQKAFARYAAMQAYIYEEARRSDAGDADPNTNRHEKLIENVEKLSDEKISLLLRAFGPQLSIDDLEMCLADDVDIAFAQLQLEAGGIVQKN